MDGSISVILVKERDDNISDIFIKEIGGSLSVLFIQIVNKSPQGSIADRLLHSSSCLCCDHQMKCLLSDFSVEFCVVMACICSSDIYVQLEALNL